MNLISGDTDVSTERQAQQQQEACGAVRMRLNASRSRTEASRCMTSITWHFEKGKNVGRENRPVLARTWEIWGMMAVFSGSYPTSVTVKLNELHSEKDEF